jgi:hypothetical protein
MDSVSVKVFQPNRTTIVSNDFRAKPNVSMAEINDVSTTGLQDGYILVYSSANNKYETKSSSNITPATVIQVDGGYF